MYDHIAFRTFGVRRSHAARPALHLTSTRRECCSPGPGLCSRVFTRQSQAETLGLCNECWGSTLHEPISSYPLVLVTNVLCS